MTEAYLISPCSLGGRLQCEYVLLFLLLLLLLLLLPLLLTPSSPDNGVSQLEVPVQRMVVVLLRLSAVDCRCRCATQVHKATLATPTVGCFLREDGNVGTLLLLLLLLLLWMVLTDCGGSGHKRASPQLTVV